MCGLFAIPASVVGYSDFDNARWYIIRDGHVVGYSEVRHLHPSLRLELFLLALAGKRVKIEKLASYAA
jgi:hypothetical protein